MLSRALLCLALAFHLGISTAQAQETDSGGPPLVAQEKSLGTGLYMTGNFFATYGTDNGSVSVFLDAIENHSSSRTSGTLRLTYWATQSYPARGAAFTGYRLAVFSPNLDPLLPGYYYSGVTRASALLTPPNGLYWMILVLEEYDSVLCPAADHFCTTDSFTSSTQRMFGPTSYPLTVTKTGNGAQAGVVVSSPAQINCGSLCTGSFVPNMVVGLTATALRGTVFTGWGGACSGTGSCTVTMSNAVNVTANFTVTSGDVGMSQTASPSPATAGKDVVFTMTATNYSLTAIPGVMVYASYDPAATVIWVSPECVLAAAGTYACNAGTIATTSSAVFKLVLRKGAGSVYNNAGLSFPFTDIFPENNTAPLAVTVNAATPGTPILRYRLYSPVTHEHHFTTDLNEYNVLGASGNWNKEGTVGKMLNNPGSFNGVTATPYYRLYNTGNQQHHWTSDANEYYTLIRFPGWSGEGVDGYILPNFATGSVQLFRLNYPYVAGLHHWTIDPFEYTALINSYGWIGEGGSGFVIQ